MLAALVAGAWPAGAMTVQRAPGPGGSPPVLTLQGRSFVSRVASSFLAALDLPELVTTSLGDYEALALALARDPARLAALRARLAENRLSKPLFDTDRLRKNLEQAFTVMVERSRAGMAPEPFAADGA